MDSRECRTRRTAPRWAGVLAALAVLFVASGCMSISYRPALSLGLSPTTINARVQMQDLEDASPPQDKGHKVGGTSATEPGTLAGDLATEITNAVFVDFQSNQVFSALGKRLEAPDLVLTGTIHRFYGHAGPNAAYWFTIPIDIIWFFGVPVLEDRGEVWLELTLARPDGTVVAHYTGRSQFGGVHTVYDNPTLGIGTKVNKAFDEAVKTIRTAMLTDQQKIESAAHGRSAPATPQARSDAPPEASSATTPASR